MKIDELAEKIGAQIIFRAQAVDQEIDRFYADDKVSELITETCRRTLVVSNIVNPHIFRVAGLVDVPAICLLDGFVPEPGMLSEARDRHLVLMVSPLNKLETVKRLYRCLGIEARLIHENRPLYD